jgi:hypothetical protein
MPCHDERTSEEYHDAEKREVRRKLTGKIDRLTRYLCAVLTSADAFELLESIIEDAETADGIERNEIAKWWSKHKAADAKRKGSTDAVV